MRRPPPRPTPYCHTLALPDALPISAWRHCRRQWRGDDPDDRIASWPGPPRRQDSPSRRARYIRGHLLASLSNPFSISQSADHQEQAACPKQFTTSDRSEEHTSELQSLMRISYAVFCLKKKKKHT